MWSFELDECLKRGERQNPLPPGILGGREKSPHPWFGTAEASIAFRIFQPNYN
jgi:hypothetical protein